MNEINRERFEAWLFSQPKERSFDFASNSDCAVCGFVKETTNLSVSAGGNYCRLWNESDRHNQSLLSLPEWLMQLLRCRGIEDRFTIAQIQARYLELFPQTEIEVATVEASKAPALTA